MGTESERPTSVTVISWVWIVMGGLMILSGLMAFFSFAMMRYINNNYVLLYKIINWWNHALPGEKTSLCGNEIKCVGGYQTRIEYNRDKHALKLINLNNSFELLSILNECENCSGPSSFKCTWLNKKYFKKTDPSSVQVITKNLNTIFFLPVIPFPFF